MNPATYVIGPVGKRIRLVATCCTAPEKTVQEVAVCLAGRRIEKNNQRVVSKETLKQPLFQYHLLETL